MVAAAAAADIVHFENALIIYYNLTDSVKREIDANNQSMWK